MIEAVGFDFDHTLGVDNKLERVAFVELAQSIAATHGVPLDEERAYEAIDYEIARFRDGKCGLSEALAGAFAAVLGKLTPPAADRLFRERALSMVSQFVQPFPGVERLLVTLRERNVPHAILTNGWNPLQQRKANAVGFRGPVLVSEDLGVRKPDPDAFRALAATLETDVGQIAYVGDDPRVDIAGALAAGLQAVWFHWEAHPYPDDIPQPTEIVHRIGDVLSLLG